MFTQKELDAVDIKYFQVLQMSAYAVTLQSKNTHHCWHIVSQSYGKLVSCQIYHTHQKYTPYHLHRRSSCMQAAIDAIKTHDKYQLNGRRKKRKQKDTTPYLDF